MEHHTIESLKTTFDLRTLFKPPKGCLALKTRKLEKKKLGKLDTERFKLAKPVQPMLPTLIVYRFELLLFIWLSFASHISLQSLSSQMDLSERQPSAMIRKF